MAYPAGGTRERAQRYRAGGHPLAERLDDIFSVLVGGARSAPPRHQALRATLDWSHDLLEGDERAAFRRLAVFSGGFALEAAERMAAGGDIKPASMLELLTRLADKSLLRVELARGDSRYHLLTTIRDYARERLAAAAESEPVLLGRGRLALLQCDYAPAVRRLEAALRLYRELDDARGIASALQVLGSVAREQGRYARAVELHAESLAVAEAAGDRWAAASAHGYLGFVCWLQRDFGRATEEAGTALAMFRDLGDVEGTAWSLISLGTIARYQGDSERASALLTESRSLLEGIAWCCEQLGLLAAVDGDPAAITLLRRSLELHGELRDRWRMSSVLEDLAAIALALSRIRAAARLLGAAEADYEELVGLLRDQVGVPPAAETTALYERLVAVS